MTTTQHSDPASLSFNAFDVFKCIRQSGFLKKQDYNPQKLKAKSTNTYTLFPSENQWKITLNRRAQQKSCGFFAKTNAPYKEFGNVELNSNKLLLESLQHIGNWFLDEKARIKSTHNIPVFTKSAHDITDRSSRQILNYQVFGEHKKPDNGIALLKLHLEKNNKHIKAVKAGQLLSKCIFNDEKKNSNRNDSLAHAESSSERKMQKLYCRELQDYLQPSVNRVEIPSTSWRKQNEFLEKLKCFEILFNSVQNMTSKDLKNKTILSSDTLKKLRQEPIEFTEEGQSMSSTLELNNKEHKSRSVQVARKPITVISYNENTSSKSINASKSGNDIIPPWFKNYIKDEDKCFQHFGNNTNSKFHKDFLHHLKNSLQTSQNKLNEKMKNELDSHVDAHLQCIKFLQLREVREKDLHIMRKQVKDWRYKIASAIKVPEKWFDILREQQTTLQLQDNEIVNEIIQRLAKHKHWKLPELSQSKFCLLIFSLPAYELCTYPMKEAAQYYSTAVLNLPGHILNEWLRARKLV
ncbi:uncharacterized protein LOC101237469 isoform X4 [Hydra vulgaris]|uniref:Uncharacterized protein LOC101237469 isoform X4 n=1 Tax=Hydra vulgaris TaxID=6087 RepID=A0ABM4CIH7_HYDVU